MAGPVAYVLVRDALTEDAIEEVRAAIRTAANRVEGDDFWIRGRPFFVMFGEEYPGELDEIARGRLQDVLGWRANGILGFAAMCNQDEDHRILAELCIRFARMLDGIIDFGGDPMIGRPFGGQTWTGAACFENPDNLQGVLYATSYVTENGLYSNAHYADVSLLEAWLKDSRFRMVK